MTTKTGIVTVKVDEKEFNENFSVVLYDSVDDILAGLQSKETAEDILGRLNYALEFRAKSNARNKIAAEQAAPDRAFANQVKAFMKSRELAGKPITEDKAKQVVRALLDAE